MPPKVVKTKEQEEEELRLKQEEERKRQEEEAKKAYEARRFQIEQYSTGLELAISEIICNEAWVSNDPIGLMKLATEKIYKSVNFFFRYTQHKQIYENFLPIDFQVLGEFHTQNLIFIKDTLNIEKSSEVCVLINLFFQLSINNNDMFGSKSTKNAQSDFTHFKQVLFNHSVDNEPSQKALFDSHQVEQILNYVQTGYIQHYKLYSYVKVNPAVVQDLEKIIYIDEPIQVPPLSQALQFDSNKIEENQVQEQECKEILLEEKEINLLDAESQEIIQNRLAELRQEMQNQIEQRQQMLDEKLIALQDPKKKK